MGQKGKAIARETPRQGERSIATESSPSGQAVASRAPLADRLRAALDALESTPIFWGLVGVALFVYIASNPQRRNQYNHFVWQADAFLHGRLAISWPVDSGPVVNAYFQDIYRVPGEPGLALLPFGPLPAFILTPFVAVFGLATDAAMVAAVLGALNVGLAWRVTSRLTPDTLVALLATIFYGFGTVAWYAAMLGSTWFFAHVAATTCLFLAIALVLDAERGKRLFAIATSAREQAASGLSIARERMRSLLRDRIEPTQFVAGLVFGAAALAREETLLGAPFFALVGSGGTFRRRALSAGIGAALMLGVLLAYNLAQSGHLLNPVYDHLYQTEYVPRPELRHREWNRIDPRYIPQNALIMLAWPPEIRPECGLSLTDRDCALVRPDPLGMSVLLTSPAYLLAFPVVFSAWRRRLVLGAALAVGAIALLLMMHFSQGWVQFGYRFSNSFAPFALVLVTLGIAKLGIRPLTVGLVAASVAINAWGVWWGVQLGW